MPCELWLEQLLGKHEDPGSIFKNLQVYVKNKLKFFHGVKKIEK